MARVVVDVITDPSMVGQARCMHPLFTYAVPRHVRIFPNAWALIMAPLCRAAAKDPSVVRIYSPSRMQQHKHGVPLDTRLYT